jgi:hypothetical protein
MHALFLKSGVYLATVGEDLVVLDVQSGDYGCLPGLGRAVPSSGPDGRLDRVDEKVAALLLEAGLADHTPPGEARTDLPPPASASCWRADPVSIALTDRRRFARAYLTGAPRFWRGRFGALVDQAKHGRPATAERAGPAIVRDAQVFDQLAPWAPFQGECLFRAFLLLAYLRLAGRDATWVFGVRTYPFRAHCWVQVGDMLLNDAVERVCAYTPILAV